MKKVIYALADEFSVV